MSPVNETEISSQQAAQALEALKPRLTALGEADFVPIRVDVLKAVPVLFTLKDVASKDLPLFLATFVDFPRLLVEELDRYALALFAAETEYRRSTTETEASERKVPEPVAAEARELRAHLQDAATYVFRTDAAVRDLLADVRRGVGYLDLADDLNRLVDVFRARWTAAEGRSAITPADLDRAARLSAEILKQLSTGGKPATDSASAAADLRRRAYSFANRAYTEIRAAAEYVHRRNPAALER